MKIVNDKLARLRIKTLKRRINMLEDRVNILYAALESKTFDEFLRNLENKGITVKKQ